MNLTLDWMQIIYSNLNHFFPLYFLFAAYLLSDLLQREDLSLSCKENEDPDKAISKAAKSVSVLQPNASEENHKDTKAKPKEDHCDGDDDYDDVFLQYLPQSEGKGNEPVHNLPQGDTSAQFKGSV